MNKSTLLFLCLFLTAAIPGTDPSREAAEAWEATAQSWEAVARALESGESQDVSQAVYQAQRAAREARDAYYAYSRTE